MKSPLSLTKSRIVNAAVYFLCSIFLLAITHTSLLAGAKNLKVKSENSSDAPNTSERKKSGKSEKLTVANYPESRSMNEWRAFEIYHPKSGVTEDSLFNIFKTRPDSAESKTEFDALGEKINLRLQVLGARSLLPILRSAFGDQVRGMSSAERDPYFLNHPTALFNPSQLNALCDNENDEISDESTDVCWKPKVTDEYLSALTDFAGDACPYLVSKEFRLFNRQKNKLVRNEEFHEQNLKTFAETSLHIPSERVTDEWIKDIVSQAKQAMESEQPENTAAFRPEDLYNMTCQAMLLSKEFYTR
jgi:hypothetical protein